MAAETRFARLFEERLGGADAANEMSSALLQETRMR
jgi:hypothetical protein